MRLGKDNPQLVQARVTFDKNEPINWKPIGAKNLGGGPCVRT